MIYYLTHTQNYDYISHKSDYTGHIKYIFSKIIIILI